MDQRNNINRFLIKLLLFSLVFIGFSFLINLLHQRVIMKNSLLNRKEKRLNQELPNIKTLVIGDSHLAAGFNTKHFGHQSFNYSGSGENYLQNYYKLKSVLKRPNSINTIVVPYELHSASSFRNNRVTDYSYYGKQIPFIKEAISQQKTSLLQDFLKCHVFSYLEQLRHWRNWWTGQQKSRRIEEGVEVRERNFAERKNQKEFAKMVTEIQFKGATSPHTEALNHLHKIKDLCKEKNKQMLLVRMPVTPHYLNELAKIQDLEQLETTTEIYRITHFPDIPYFNFRDSIPSLQLFSDSNHLNFEGSKQFSKRLINTIYARGIDL